MLIAGKRLLDEFTIRHAQSRQSVKTWLDEIGREEYGNPQEIKDRFPSADFLSENRVIFNLSGNKYRLIVRMDYESGRVSILRIGTHQEYDRWVL